MSLLMKMMAEAMTEESDKKPLPTVEGQRLLLDEFLAAQDRMFRVGDEVVLTENGKLRYRFPRDGQVARVSAIFYAVTLEEGGRRVHGEIVVVGERGSVLAHIVDFRYYRLAPQEAA